MQVNFFFNTLPINVINLVSCQPGSAISLQLRNKSISNNAPIPKRDPEQPIVANININSL